MLLELKAVSKKYQESQADVLRDIDLTLSAGETLAVVGPSGCGKSTLLNCIGGLDHPSAGTVLLDGKDLGKASADELAALRATTLGFIFQDHHLLPQCSALENVLLPVMALPVRPPRRDSEALALRLLEQVGLGGKQDRRPVQLSGGERQRVAVARALINRPKLLLADEPTGALDQETAAALAEVLLDLNRKEGTALIVVTHAPALAKRMGRTLALRGGRIDTAAAAAS